MSDSISAFPSGSPPAARSSPPRGAAVSVWLAPLLLALATLLCWRSSLTGAFVFDDVPTIGENPTIRHRWPLSDAFAPPPGGLPVTGRPVANFTLALDYAVSGTDPWSYHATNLLIHLLAGLALYGLVRRTLQARPGRAPGAATATGLGVAVALLWIVHPLQTEAVTYVVQRTESLMGLFYLLTLYCFRRALDTARPRAWLVLAWAACLLGMGTKEVMVTAPVMVLLYDRVFGAGSIRAAWRQHGGFHASLAATWLPLGWLVAGAGSRGGSAGFGLAVSPLSYALNQGAAIAHYLGLALWPHPLVIDYGARPPWSTSIAAAGLAFVALLATATVLAWRRRPAAGFLGVWFLGILAPTSSVVPIATEFMAERRMYLPLAAVIVVLVVGLHRIGGRAALIPGLMLAVGWAWLTARRNAAYRSEVALWTDAVTARPGNARARCNLGSALLAAGRPAAALAAEQEALRLQPDLAAAAFYAGTAAERLGHPAEARADFEQTLRLQPDDTRAHLALGNLFALAGRYDAAEAQFAAAVSELPGLAPAHYNLAMARLQRGRPAAAIAELETALRLDPTMAEAAYNLGAILLQRGDLAGARVQFERTLALQPANSAAHDDLGNILLQEGRAADAVAQYRAALRTDPANVAAHCNLGTALLQLQRVPDARREFEQALRLQPDYPPARAALDQLGIQP